MNPQTILAYTRIATKSHKNILGLESIILHGDNNRNCEPEFKHKGSINLLNHMFSHQFPDV